jgi:hypothetical protein
MDDLMRIIRRCSSCGTTLDDNLYDDFCFDKLKKIPLADLLLCRKCKGECDCEGECVCHEYSTD